MEKLISQTIEGTKKSWDQLTEKERQEVTAAGWTPGMYDDFGGNSTDIGGTYQDPAVYFSVIMGGWASGLWATMGEGAISACIASEACASFVLGIQAFNQMPTEAGYHRHHLLDVCFARMLGIDPKIIPSVYKIPSEHKIFTNLSRAVIPYGTRGASIDTIWNAMQSIYADYPVYLEAVRRFLENQGFIVP